MKTKKKRFKIEEKNATIEEKNAVTKKIIILSLIIFLRNVFFKLAFIKNNENGNDDRDNAKTTKRNENKKKNNNYADVNKILVLYKRIKSFIFSLTKTKNETSANANVKTMNYRASNTTY